MSDDIEQKINDIHGIVIGIQADMKADKTICVAQHSRINADIGKLDKVLNGNGVPGLKQRFDSLEAKVVAWTAMAVIVGQVLAPIVKAWAIK